DVCSSDLGRAQPGGPALLRARHPGLPGRRAGREDQGAARPGRVPGPALRRLHQLPRGPVQGRRGDPRRDVRGVLHRPGGRRLDRDPAPAPGGGLPGPARGGRGRQPRGAGPRPRLSPGSIPGRLAQWAADPPLARRPRAVPSVRNKQMTQTITVIRGDGIGPEIMEAALHVLDAMDVGLSYEFAEAGVAALEATGELLPAATMDSIRRNKVAL